MADRTFTMAESSEAFRAAAHWWRSLVGGIEDHQWALMALGEWNVTELVAHTSRAFTTVVDYSRGSVKDPTPIASAAEYFRIVLAEETPHLHIAARARTEASAHTDWLQATDDRWAAAAQVIDNTPGEQLMHLFVGEMPLRQYLATRVVELAVHGLDLGTAIGIPSNPPPAAARLALEVLLDLSTGDDTTSLLRLLTGRDGRLPLTNVLG